MSDRSDRDLAAKLIACYDLYRRLPTYDYFNWLCHVRLLGASEITIWSGGKLLMRKKWPREETFRRLDNFMLPGPRLFGMPCRLDSVGDREAGSHMWRDLWQAAQEKGCGIPRIKSVLAPRSHRFTVTLRDSLHKPERNSDREVWTQFAKKIGARLIDDHRHEPLGLYERFAIYAGAQMNFGVVTGPLGMLYYSDVPFRLFLDPAINTIDYARQGHGQVERLPWFRNNQRFVWMKPNFQLLLQQSVDLL